MIIDGEQISAEIIRELKLKSNQLKTKPVLNIILIGNDQSSEMFVSKKAELAKELGFKFVLQRFPETVTEQELIEQIDQWQKSQKPSGVMVQLPIPKHLNRENILNQIKPNNDVDGLRFCLGEKSCFVPPVVLAIERALKEAKVDFESKTITIVGKGFLVGWPLLCYLTEKYSVNIKIVEKQQLLQFPDTLKESSIVIGAANQANIINSKMIPEGTIIIDAGSIKHGIKINGNFNRDCYEVASFYTPVPGGIGPMTVAYLFQNLVDMAKR